ncbi:MAG: hypothetical protein Q4C75_04470 [Bergeyella zoohelcum]|nr:hypothetical protein [Bergeyella zoohelcum]
MNETALAEKIKNIILEIREDTDNPDGAMETFCNELAKVIIKEVRKATITATCTHGPVNVSKIE